MGVRRGGQVRPGKAVSPEPSAATPQLQKSEGRLPEQREFAYSTWSHGLVLVTAHTVEFTPTHVVFRDEKAAIIAAIAASAVLRLVENGAAGSSSLGDLGAWSQ